MNTSTSQPYTSTKTAFTIVELLMVMAIMFIMTYLSLANYNRFGREVELENAVYELALTIRQAQFFGINRNEQFGETFDDPQPYGIYFNLDATEEEIDDESFMMYIDQDQNKLFDTADNTYGGGEACTINFSDECIDTYQFTRSSYSYDICVGTDEGDCTSVSDLGGGSRELHISFKRPDPDATIRRNSATPAYAYAKITLRSPIVDIPEKSVSVGAAGLISIN